MDIIVTDQPDASRYEARRGEYLLGFIDYKVEGNTLVLTHTEIDPQYGGQGVGGALVGGTLDDVRSRGLKVRPMCEFVQGWLAKHPDYQDLDLTTQDRP